ncbi:MAG: hypothetical protein ACI8TX_003584 [Hyphomicrobiaceae bacterium]|jgi:hypothetical protein
MRIIFRAFLTVSLAAVFLTVGAATASAQFDNAGAKCRAQVGKNATKYAKTVTKEFAKCDKNRLKKGTGPCSTIAEVDLAKGKIAKAAGKFGDLIGGTKDKCDGETATALLYENCPTGPGPNNCSGAITSFADVSACLTCLIDDTAVELHTAVQGAPSAVGLDKDQIKCHTDIGKFSSKQAADIIKDVTICQFKAENGGVDTVENCTVTTFPSAKATKSITKTFDKVNSSCGIPNLAALDSCDTTQLATATCVRDLTTAAAQTLAIAAVSLEGAPVTTTTTTSTSTTTTSAPTTTSTLPVADADCPTNGSLTVLAGVSTIPCGNNGDCGLPRTCDTGLGVCTTVSDLDTGRTGFAHDSDVNEEVLTRGLLNCPGPSPTCGVCQVTGIDNSTDSCRCSNDNRVLCNEPFAADAACGGETCDCFFGPPLPLSSSGVAACVVNRFANNLTGTANVDTGSGQITANLRAVVYLGPNGFTPCPYCGGQCSGDGSIDCSTDESCDFACEGLLCNGGPNDGVACTLNSECSAGTCSGLDPTPNDGVRGGTCKGTGGENLGETCDAQAFNTTFPANGGGWHSLDCFPGVGTNTTGQGLQVNLAVTTGTAPSITAAVPCGGFFNSQDCHCRVCRDLSNTDTPIPCSTNQECVDQGFKDCLGGLATPQNNCANIANCVPGGGNNPDGACSDRDATFCDGFSRANGNGILTCTTNGDCSAVSSQAGNCTSSIPNPCFPSTVTGQGTPDPDYPIGVATFCLAPSGSAGINGAAGLPGPGRAVQQSIAEIYCFNDTGKIYTAGVGCPAGP